MHFRESQLNLAPDHVAAERDGLVTAGGHLDRAPQRAGMHHRNVMYCPIRDKPPMLPILFRVRDIGTDACRDNSIYDDLDLPQVKESLQA